MVRTLLILLVIAATGAGLAYAGRNAGGALIVHTNDAMNYRSLGLCLRFETVDSPGSCEAALTRTNKDTDTPAFIWIIAAFPQGSDPGVSRIDFGLLHNLPPGQGYVPNFGLCGPAGTTESHGPGWPDTGGDTVTYGAPILHDLFFPVYYVNAFGFAGAYLGTGAHPGLSHAAFHDDSMPPALDVCSLFGAVRWHEPGYNSCPDGPPPNACCYPDGHCALVSLEQDCIANGGTPQGQVPCEPNPCGALPGACCFESGECVQSTPADCFAAGGLFVDFDLACEPNPCPPPSACCLLDGSCRFMTEFTCSMQDGDWHAGTICADAGCPPGGACCFIDGTCSVFTAAECASRAGAYQGDATTCGAPPCPPASACCFENGSCTVLIETECAARGGSVLASEATCSPNPCIGACCFFNGSCEVTTIATCLASNAEYLGSDFPCEPNPCETAGVPDAASQPRTWGQIKAGYR